MARRPIDAWAFPARTWPAAIRRRSSSRGTTAILTTATACSISRRIASRAFAVVNLSVCVVRILCRPPDELATTDIADYALDALRKSRVKEVYLLGRRGPAQAAFTNPEVKELGELADADVAARPEEVELAPLSPAAG